jgi:hypothetical protein
MEKDDKDEEASDQQQSLRGPSEPWGLNQQVQISTKWFCNEFFFVCSKTCWQKIERKNEEPGLVVPHLPAKSLFTIPDGFFCLKNKYKTR